MKPQRQLPKLQLDRYTVPDKIAVKMNAPRKVSVTKKTRSSEIIERDALKFLLPSNQKNGSSP